MKSGREIRHLLWIQDLKGWLYYKVAGKMKLEMLRVAEFYEDYDVVSSKFEIIGGSLESH